jgi:hypothetical protein
MIHIIIKSQKLNKKMWKYDKLHLSEEKAREIGKLARKYIPIHLSPLSPSKNKE